MLDLSWLFRALAAATAIGIPLYAWRVRGRFYAIFSAVMLTISLPGAVLLHTRLATWLGEPGALNPTEEVTDGYPAIVKYHLTGLGALVPELPKIVTDDEPGSVGFDQNDAHAPMRWVGIRIRLHQYWHDARSPGVGDPRLCPRDDVVVAVAARARPYALKVAARVRFGESNAGADGAGRQDGKPPLTLFHGAVAHDHPTCE